MDAARKPDNGPGNPTPAAVTDMVRYDPLQNITYGRGGFQTRPLSVHRPVPPISYLSRHSG